MPTLIEGHIGGSPGGLMSPSRPGHCTYLALSPRRGEKDRVVTAAVFDSFFLSPEFHGGPVHQAISIMSFFKKLAKDFEQDFKNLGLGSDKKEQKPPTPSGGNYPPPPQNQGYGSPSPYQQQQQHHGYSTPPPPQHEQQTRDYAPPPNVGPRPPPPYQPPSDKPPLPSGWVPRWDDRYQRWYYAEESTGRTQWEAPGHDVSAGTRSHGSGGGYSGHSGYAPPAGYGGGGYQPQGGYGAPQYSQGEHKEKKSSNKMAIAGGVAAGAVGGVLLANALHDSDSDSDHGGHSGGYAPAAAAAAAAPVPTYVTNNYYYGDESPAPPPAPYGEPAGYGDVPPGHIPTHNAYGEEIDSSDRESLKEARERYEEALEDAASSSASSSDLEELEEARQEYQEEYEEAYYDED
ncbi:hypothetical protein QBC40DRAFT_275533 [Triangularia verruculosa]|uniref:WW domain-containing protein n=1 Tax=Triangularia verruculosa TaxID=2587418 RepID=A0AAN6XLM7_9PEZI|nr:hypothetical protein QBC40DRAFT_275533 [Triangularia verruculosa]